MSTTVYETKLNFIKNTLQQPSKNTVDILQIQFYKTHTFLLLTKDSCKDKTYFMFFSLIKCVFELCWSMISLEKSSGIYFYWKDVEFKRCLCFHINCQNKPDSCFYRYCYTEVFVHSYSLPHWKKFRVTLVQNTNTSLNWKRLLLFSAGVNSHCI